MMDPYAPKIRSRRRQKRTSSSRKSSSVDLREEVRGLKVTAAGVAICVLVVQILSSFNTSSVKSVKDTIKSGLSFTPTKLVCQWAPDSHDECNQLLEQRLPPQIITKYALRENEEHFGPRKERWLFFGDSTMKRYFTASNLDRHLVGEPMHFMRSANNGVINPCWSGIHCKEKRTDQCDMGREFGFRRVVKWKKPLFYPNFEGPVNYGVDNPYCSDCGGCGSQFLHCSRKIFDLQDIKRCTKPKLSYGGFMKIEFAKDVELQTAAYNTTQENTALYLRDHFNKPELVEEWGKPICVILAGFHDMVLLLKTEHFGLDKFVNNVEWYLNVMRPECSHIIWLTNTAPSFENPKKWPQTVELVKEWNDGVVKMIEQNYELQEMTTVVDVYISSLDVAKKDHIHLIDEWYNIMGHYFSALVTERNIDEI